MHKEEEEYCVNYLICPSFSIYSSDKLDNIVHQLKTDHHNDTFEFLTFPHQIFFHPNTDADDSIQITNSKLDAIPADTYCVWTPKSLQPNRCKKSNSTPSTSSSSKIWKLLDLLRRTKSTFNSLKKKAAAKSENCGSSNGKKLSGNRERKLPVRRTYLPYKQGFFGFPLF
ncbi:hypothetical protein Lalb_Chr21g0319491 [Lupinus albus]|uniref:Uncharacterized protein n=1 Tax=Lupinus albus TaxID=3870 RepID=A0A6A4NM67_LUPAL|nr:hypothetical protein Lalb_Chr21g0319491 [Lupinus albus]